MFLLRVLRVFVCLLLLFDYVLSAVALSRDNIVTIPGGTAIFRCETNGDLGPVGWLINGNHLEDTHDMNVAAFGRENLLFSNVSMRYNSTTVQCRVGDSHSDVGNLFVQGNLGAITNLTIIQEDFTVSLTWTAPFSFDIPVANPDITYCVDVVDSTSMSKLHSQCDLVNTEFNLTIVPNKQLKITVTPVNLVGNGTRVSTFFSLVPEASTSTLQAIQATSEATSGGTNGGTSGGTSRGTSGVTVLVVAIAVVVGVLTFIFTLTLGVIILVIKKKNRKCRVDERYTGNENVKVFLSEDSENSDSLRASLINCPDGNHGNIDDDNLDDDNLDHDYSQKFQELTAAADSSMCVYHCEDNLHACTDHEPGGVSKIFVQGARVIMY